MRYMQLQALLLIHLMTLMPKVYSTATCLDVLPMYNMSVELFGNLRIYVTQVNLIKRGQRNRIAGALDEEFGQVGHLI